MLDVHSPEHTPHTWRDFFIHIATIVVGLIIAVGLEQSVEFFHHRHEIKEDRRALRLEREQNRRHFAQEVTFLRYDIVQDKNNLLVLSYLKRHPGTPEEKLPGELRWSGGYGGFIDSAWQNVKRTNVTALMPQKEVQHDEDVYDEQAQVQAADRAVLQDHMMAREYSYLDPDPSHMSPTQVDREIVLEQHALRDCTSWALSLSSLQDTEPDLTPPLTEQDFNSYRRSPEDMKKLKNAQSLTDARMALAQAQLNAVFRAANKTK